MNSLLEWLLGLSNIRLAEDAPLLLKWHPPVPAWALFSLVLVALAWTVFTYGKESLPRGRRIVLAALRLTTLAIVIVVICRPSLMLQRNRVERSYVALAIDNSLSMATAEPYSDDELAQHVAVGAGLDEPGELLRRSRLELVKAALTRNAPGVQPQTLEPGRKHKDHLCASPLCALLAAHDVELVTFAGNVEAKGYFSSPAALSDLESAMVSIEATGATTDLGGAVREIVARTQGRRLAAIILATDGQATQSTDLKDALDLARDRRVPVLCVRIGSIEPRWDVMVDSLRAPEHVLAGDLVTLVASVSAKGLSNPKEVLVRLLDENGSTIASQSVKLDPKQPEAAVEFRVTAEKEGRRRYRVEAELPTDVGSQELTVQNNSQTTEIRVLQSHGRVLYVEGYPRYEYRYLKNALLREPSMEVSVLLLEADEQFVQEGTLPIRRFPQSSEELSRFDVVLFGDVDPAAPGWLSSAQIDMLLEFVADHGGGFGLIAGERAAPRRFLGSGLEALIPVRIDPAFSGAYEAPARSGYRPRLTVDGQTHPIFRFAADKTQDRDSPGLLQQLPELYWLAGTLGPKPGAAVLLEHPTLRVSDSGGHAGISADSAMPLVVTGRYGAGKIFYQATDDTWRWRRHTGEFLYDTYWIRVVRYLMPHGRGAMERRWALRTDARVYPFGSTVRVVVEARHADPQMLADLPAQLTLQLFEDDDSGRPGQPGDEAQPPSGVAELLVSRVDVHRLSEEDNVFEGSCVPPRPGRYTLRLTEPGLSAVSGRADQSESGEVAVRLRVEPPGLEGWRPQADHERLQRIAAATGGKVVDLDELRRRFQGIQDRSVLIPDDLEEPLWDSKLVLILFATMISGEWILRKVFGAM